MKCSSNLYEIPISQVFLPALLPISESHTCLSVQRMNSNGLAGPTMASPRYRSPPSSQRFFFAKRNLRLLALNQANAGDQSAWCLKWHSGTLHCMLSAAAVNHVRHS